MPDHDDMMREFAREVAQALEEDYADEACCECDCKTLVMIGTVLRCDVCGNQQIPTAKQLN